MRWIWRELSLATSAASAVLVLQPGWSAAVSRGWLVVVAILVSAAVIFEVFGRAGFSVSSPSGRPTSRDLKDKGERPQSLREVPQADDFVAAVDYTLVPFLRRAVKEVAAQRLLARYGVVLDREPERAHSLLGDVVWQALEQPSIGAANWPARDLDELISTLESI